MAIHDIVNALDPFLRKISEPVAAVDDGVRTLVADMFETMYAAPGIGLAAIQIGVPQRILVIDLQRPDEDAAGPGEEALAAARAARLPQSRDRLGVGGIREL